MALGLPWGMIWTDMELDADAVRQRLEEQANRSDPYPLPGIGSTANVSVTPGNARKGESATSVSNPGSNGGKGRGG